VNSKRPSLTDLATRWREVPGSEKVCDAANSLIHRATAAADFHGVLIEVTRALVASSGRNVSDNASALGLAIELLGDELETLHVAFLGDDPTATQAVVVLLRDSLLGRLQADHRRYLLSTCCAEFRSREALVAVWVEKHPGMKGHQPWEFTDCIEEILDSHDAGEQLLTQLRKRK
jgi:hypothetical protein